MSDQSFSQLNLSEAELSNLDNLGYVEMTEVQSQALPLALQGKDVVAQAKTGSGKTAAFAIPLLHSLNAKDFDTQALVLCPTRELASQVASEIRRLARFQHNVKVVTLCGGQSMGRQISSLEHGAHVVVGTPGRISDHLSKNTLDISTINTLVLDEADRMLDMGFIDEIESIIYQTPDDRQTLLFSATYPEDIQDTSARFQKSPEYVSVEAIHDESSINQKFFSCPKGEKLSSLIKLLQRFQPSSVVVFCNTKIETENVSQFLSNSGVSALALHGDLEQKDRDQLLIQFKQRSCTVLAATDVAARGLDIEELPMVINYDLPPDPEVYVHRIGRTGRAEKEGVAIALFADNERHRLQRLGDYLGQDIDFDPIESLAIKNQSIPYPPYITICINGGRKQKLRPGDILGALTGEGGIEGKSVGKIDVLDFAAYVAIENKHGKKALNAIVNGKIKGRKFKARFL